MGILREPKYGEFNWKPGLNCKGLPINRNPSPEISSERGKRREQRKREGKIKKHQHEWKVLAPFFNSSYSSERVMLETRQFCKECDKQVKRLS